jgi:NAD(P)-dependent dehydrogenase (short-subunit alcohol dehydrogenase family)
MNKPEKYVLITGASSGIGESSAIILADRGFKVFAGVRKEVDGKKLGVRKNITPIFIDVNDHSSVDGAFSLIAEEVGDRGLCGLVNNAGIAVPGALEFISIEKLRWQMETNFIGQVKVTQTFLPLVRKAKGRIVNISSIAGLVVSPFSGAYCASKYAVEAFTDALRRELAPWGIHVCAVEPGVILTNIWQRSLDNVKELHANMSEAETEYYLPYYNAKLEKMWDKIGKHAISPDCVAKAVLKALTARNPRTRYPVGNDALLVNLLQHLPDGLIDRLVALR